MPREMVHWEILLSSMPEIRKVAPKLAASLDSAMPLALVGALTPDAPYYHNFGRSSFEEVGEFLHGGDAQDTFAAPRSMLTLGRDDSKCISFVVGYVSHCIVDSIFHPLVYYFSGDYYAESPVERVQARRRHRALEVYIDEFWRKEFSTTELKATTPAFLQSEMYKHLDPLSVLLSKAVPNSTSKLWRESLRDMFRIIRLCINLPMGLILTNFNVLLGGRFQGEQALLRYGRRHVPDWISTQFEFRNPASGEKTETSLEILRTKAINGFVSTCVQIEEMIFLRGNHSTGTQSFLSLVGASLNTGLIGSRKTDLKFFDPKDVK